MAKIQLSEGTGFKLLPVGRHKFTVESVVYKEKFGSIVIQLLTDKGMKHTESYKLLRNDLTVNSGAQWAFTIFARGVMGDPYMNEVDPDDLVGRQFWADVTHVESENRKEPENPYINVRFENFEAIPSEDEGYDEEEETEDTDLEALLGL